MEHGPRVAEESALQTIMTPELWQRLKPLYEAAIGKPPGKRAEFISTACQDDHELREELESLLSENDGGGQSLDTPLFKFEKLFDEKKRVFTKGERILGRFEVLSYIGHGGMGEVYRARDPKLDRELAIKVLLS